MQSLCNRRMIKSIQFVVGAIERVLSKYPAGTGSLSTGLSGRGILDFQAHPPFMVDVSLSGGNKSEAWSQIWRGWELFAFRGRAISIP